MNTNTFEAQAMYPTDLRAPNEFKSFAQFARTVTDNFWTEETPFLNKMAQELTRVENGETKRLLILLPPRHAKSLTVSQLFPSWFLGRNPEKRVILTAYEPDFAASWGRKVKDILTKYGPSLFGVWISRQRNADHSWDIAGHNGGMETAGVTRPITGRGSDLFVIDDPIKNSSEAVNYEYNQLILDWFDTTVMTRLNPDSALVITMTRWARKDLAGRLLQRIKDNPEEDKKWVILTLPAFAELNDPLGREEGEPLWPEKFPAYVLGEIRNTLRTYWFNAMYQQNPEDLYGNRP